MTRPKIKQTISLIRRELVATRKVRRHWQRMDAWAATRDQKEQKSYFLMDEAISEHWSSGHCAYCQQYFDHPNCHGCPLCTYYGSCITYDSRFDISFKFQYSTRRLRDRGRYGINAYQGILRAETWADFRRIAKKLIHQVDMIERALLRELERARSFRKE